MPKKSEKKETINIFGLEDDEDSRARLFQYLRDLRFGTAEVSVEHLRARLNTFLTSMTSVIQSMPDDFGEYTLETVTFTVEISAKGTVSLLGSGGEVAGKSGLAFVLKRQQ